MGLFQRAAETYDNMAHLAGVTIDGKTPLAPIGYATTKANVIITLDVTGKFKTAEPTEEKIMFPVTESSVGRANAPAPHALCDNLGYVADFNKTKHQLYVEQLEKWATSDYGDDKLNAVLHYVKTGTILADLRISVPTLFDDDGKLKDEKTFVIWRVLGCGNRENVWEDTELMQKYAAFHMLEVAKRVKDVCYVSGDKTYPAVQHLKGVFSLNGNAKLISANDGVNFTYRGRFITDTEAINVSYVASQKAHNALKWLLANDGVIIGERAFVCWNPKGKEVPKIDSPLQQFLQDEKPTPTVYKQTLAKKINGYKANLDITDSVIVAAFDAATTGRLATTYYNEFGAHDFLTRLQQWDETCCMDSTIHDHGVYSPALARIVDAAFGTQRGEFIETDAKVMAQQLQRLVTCRLDGALFPTDVMRAAVNHCSNIQTLTPGNRKRQLFTTCAIIRKYYFDHEKEEWNMALEPQKQDRSYQYGRLLAVLEKMERDTFDNGEKRETNAIRSQAVFVKRPAYASKLLLERLKTSYFPKLSVGARVYYDKIIGEIMAVISDCGEADFNKSLNETYLLGYYLQKNALYAGKNNENNNTEDEQQ